MSDKNKVLAVVGPTGAGKTKLASVLAARFNGVIISADSRQVYRGLDVGTNKEGRPGDWFGQPARFITVTLAAGGQGNKGVLAEASPGSANAEVPQLLIDIVEPGGRFTLLDWLTKARQLLATTRQQGKLPIVVGGTGLYVTALLEGYQPGGGRYSQERQAVDFSSLVLMPDIRRQDLYRNSDERYWRIFDDLIKETTGLLQAGVSSDWLISLGLDYRYSTLFVLGQRNRELAVAEFQQASRQYIRRQLTWWRHHGSVVPVNDELAAGRQVEEFLKK
jgi:tRNA A37 N6-isopentenylltransferase MiaA